MATGYPQALHAVRSVCRTASTLLLALLGGLPAVSWAATTPDAVSYTSALDPALQQRVVPAAWQALRRQFPEQRVRATVAGLGAARPVRIAAGHASSWRVFFPRPARKRPDGLYLVEGRLESPGRHAVPVAVAFRIRRNRIATPPEDQENASAPAPKRAVAVRRGERVTVTLRDGPITLRTRALAREDGRVGDSIEMENAGSGRRFVARVTGAHAVKIGRRP